MPHVRIIPFHFFVLLYILYASFPLHAKESDSASCHLSYTIRPIKINKEVHLEVHLKFRAEAQVSTYLFLPSSWAGQTKLYHEIVKLESLTSDANLEATEQPDIVKILHDPNQKIELKYVMKSTHSDASEWYYRPIIEKNHFLFFGHCFFITPQVDVKRSAHITMEWKDFPKNWSLANSFGSGERKQELHMPLKTFQHATFCGGDFILIPFEKKGSRIVVAIRGDWSFSVDHLTQMLQTIIQGQRSFWKDDHFPFYLITVMPAKSERHNAGTALHHAFSIFINDFPETSHDSWNALSWLLSHEHFHTWNGLKMEAKSTDESMLWFTEGFTEYYALELNLRMNLLNFEDYLKAVNGLLYDYYTSPARNAKNEKIPDKFWKESNYQRLPYLRGFLLALNWNQAIRKRTKDSASLDDVMLALFKKVKKSGRPFDCRDIEQLVGKYIGEKTAEEDIERYIHKGKTIPIDDHLFEDLAVIEWMENIGFNVKETQAKGWLNGVVKGSKAYRAGLRDGQLFLNWTLSDHEIIIYISDDGRKIKEIKFIPENREEFIPQFLSIPCFGQLAS